MKSAKIYLAVIILMLFLFSGCISFGQKEGTTARTFLGGNQGLMLSFPAGQVTEVFEKNPFTVIVRVDNRGEADVDKARISIGGVISGVDYTESLSASGLILGEQIQGGTDIMQFDSPKGISVEADRIFTLAVTATYPYNTTAVATACIKESAVQQTVGQVEVCRQGQLAVQSSGAPVQVVSLTQLPTGFQFTIANAGGGTPYVATGAEPYSADAGADLESAERDKVYVTSIGLLETGGWYTNFAVKCGKREVKLSNNQATVFCEIDLSKLKGTYTDTLTIVLQYGYKQSASRQIKIYNIEK